MWQPNWCQVLGGESLFKLGQHCIGLVMNNLYQLSNHSSFLFCDLLLLQVMSDEHGVNPTGERRYDD